MVNVPDSGFFGLTAGTAFYYSCFAYSSGVQQRAQAAYSINIRILGYEYTPEEGTRGVAFALFFYFFRQTPLLFWFKGAVLSFVSKVGCELTFSDTLPSQEIRYTI